MSLIKGGFNMPHFGRKNAMQNAPLNQICKCDINFPLKKTIDVYKKKVVSICLTLDLISALQNRTIKSYMYRTRKLDFIITGFVSDRGAARVLGPT
jgi:hypothetical protein